MLFHLCEPSVEPGVKDKGSGGLSWLSRPGRKVAAGDRIGPVLSDWVTDPQTDPAALAA